MTKRGVLTLCVGVGLVLQVVGTVILVLDGSMTPWRWAFSILGIASAVLVLWSVGRISG